ncbi:hypothetical protein MRY87_13070 [bacterium]|nr:hypothetical protein [bacterium]
MEEKEEQMLLRTIDGKGRVALGASFANLPVRIEADGYGEWKIRVIEAIPASEVWLMKNKEALNLVTTGILQARNHEFADDPTEGREYSWLDEVDVNVSDQVD